MDAVLSGDLRIVTFFPLIGIPIVLAISLLWPTARDAIRRTVLVVSAVEFILSIPLFVNFQTGVAGMQFEYSAPWIESLGIGYHVGVDGISLFLVLLTTFITPIVVLSAWRAVDQGVGLFHSLLLLIESALIGTFTALDLALFFVFWEAVLIPMYFLIGIWGSERRIHAAVKFFLYTAFGSALMLVAILYLWGLHVEQFSRPSLDYFDLLRLHVPFDGVFSPQSLCFLAFALAFAIKIPLFPFHTWLPDAHVEAPTAGSVILAALLLKMGSYAFLRFLVPLFPDAVALFLPYLAALAIVGIIYGAMVAFAQGDLKKLVAYSSVSHMGLIMLGVLVFTTQGIQGAVYQMLNHGLSTGALFLVVGMIYERRHTKAIAEMGGLAKVMPVFAAFFLLSVLSSIGLPMLNGFVGEFLLLLGVFRYDYTWAALGATGVILGAVYMLWAYQKVMLGPLDKKENKALLDLGVREVFVLLPIAVMMVVMGVYPKPFLARIEPSVLSLRQQVQERAHEHSTARTEARDLLHVSPRRDDAP